jgi:hypothetical protein
VRKLQGFFGEEQNARARADLPGRFRRVAANLRVHAAFPEQRRHGRCVVTDRRQDQHALV